MFNITVHLIEMYTYFVEKLGYFCPRRVMRYHTKRKPLKSLIAMSWAHHAKYAQDCWHGVSHILVQCNTQDTSVALNASL